MSTDTERDYDSLARLAREKARFSMHQGNPGRAQEWIRAAELAERAGWAHVTAPTSDAERAAVLEAALREIRVAWDTAGFPIRCPSPVYKRVQDALRKVDDAL